MIIDGTNLIVGRTAVVAAKKALEGERVDIINCEKMIITGPKKTVLERFKEKQKIGHPYHGPFLHKMPDRLVRRMIRGMLPYKKERGAKAYKRIRCHIGVPDDFKGKSFETLESADMKKLKTKNYLSVKEISKLLGKKI